MEAQSSNFPPSESGQGKQIQARPVAQIRAERATPVGDAAAAVRSIVVFYDGMGEWSLTLQAQEAKTGRAS